MRELRAESAPFLDAVRPVHDRAVAGPAPVRRDLLRPLERCVHRPCPTDGVVVVRARRPELVHLAHHELGRLERGHAVEVGHLVERAVHGALGGRAVVADDVVDERVAEDPEVLDRVDEPADVVIDVLEEPGVHLHLALEHGLERRGHVVPRRDLGVSRGQLGALRDDTQLLLPGERLLAQRVPALGERAVVPIRPLRGDVMGRVRRPRCEVHEERLVGHQRLLLAHPAHGAVGEVLGQVVPLLRGRGRFDGRRAVVQRRLPLVVLAADEAVEGLEPAAARRPGVERAERRRLPHRHLVALAELRGGVPVQLEGQRQRRLRVRPHRAVAGRRRGRLRDAAHPDRVVVAAGEQRLAGRRAERSGVEAVVAQPARGQSLRGRTPDRAAERARSPEADVVEEHDEDVGRARRWEQRLDRRKGRVRVLGVVRRQPDVGLVRDRQDVSSDPCVRHRMLLGESITAGVADVVAAIVTPSRDACA